MSARIQQIYIAMFGRPADPLGLNFWNAQTNNGANLAPIVNALAGTAEYQARFAGQSNVQLVNSIYQSLFGRDADVAGLTFFTNQLASGAMNLGTIAINILDGAQGTDKARVDNKVTAATAFTAAIDTTAEILAYNSAAVPAAQAFLAGITDVATTIPNADATATAIANIVSGSSGVVGTTFPLATTPDNIVGTANNDTITGYVNTTTGNAGTTLTAADQINGGAGVDTLAITVDGAGNDSNGLPAATISNVEVISVRNVATGGAQVYDLALVAGETRVINNGSTRDVTFNNVGAGSTVQTNAQAAATTFTMAAVTDAVSININGGATTGNITRNQTGSATVSITSTGAANKVGTIDLDTGTAVKALTIDATTNLTATLAADYAADSTLSIKGGAASVDLSGAALSNNFKSVDASGLTVGGASVVLGANTTSFVGGAGNDTVAVNALVFGGTVKVDGGAGTGDVLVLTDAAALTKVTAANLVNFETLRLADDDDAGVDVFDVSMLSGITAIQLNADSAGDGYTVNGLTAAQAAAITIRGTQAVAPTFGVTNATNVGQLDTLKLAIDDGAAAKGDITVANLNAAGVETISITAVENFTATSLTGLTAMTNLNVSGVGNVSLTTAALAANVNSTIDASAATGTVTINASAATANGFAIKGSSTATNTITGTAQADIITGGTGKDTVTNFGAGNDTVDFVSDSSVDQFNISVLTGRTTITNFDVATTTTTEDLVNVAADAVDGGEVVITNAGAQAAIVTDRTYVIEQTVGAAGSLTAAGTATVTDFTNLTQVATFLSERFTFADASAALIFVNNGTNTFAYSHADAGGGVAATTAAELTLVGVFNGAVLNNGDIFQTV